MENNIVVVLEFGNSALRCLASRVEGDGKLNVLAYERLDLDKSFMNEGWISAHKYTDLSYKVKEILRLVSNRLNMNGRTIGDVYLTIAGRSMMTQIAVVTSKSDEPVTLTSEKIQSFASSKRKELGISEELPFYVLSFNIDGQLMQKIPKNPSYKALEINYLFIRSKKNFLNDYSSLFSKIPLNNMGLIMGPIAQVQKVLSSTEKRSGVLYLDFGAQQTSMVVVQNNLVKDFVVIPFGGNSLTDDLSKECNLNFDKADTFRLKELCFTSNLEDLNVSEEVGFGDEVIDCRMREIIMFVLDELDEMKIDLKDLRAGIVYSGGVGESKGLDSLLSSMTGLSTRKASISSLLVETSGDKVDALLKDTGVTNIVCSAFFGDQDCSGEEPSSPGLFGRKRSRDKASSDNTNEQQSKKSKGGFLKGLEQWFTE